MLPPAHESATGRIARAVIFTNHPVRCLTGYRKDSLPIDRRHHGDQARAAPASRAGVRRPQGWHHEMVPALERLGRGEAPYPSGAYDDFDAWNARFVDARKGRSATEILSEMEASHRELISAASRLPDEQFAEGKPATGMIDGAGPGHYREHADQIREWRRR